MAEEYGNFHMIAKELYEDEALDINGYVDFVWQRTLETAGKRAVSVPVTEFSTAIETYEDDDGEPRSVEMIAIRTKAMVEDA